MGAVYLIVHNGMQDNSSSAATTATTHTAAAKKPKATPKKRSYVVRSGDTLTAIAGRTGVSVDRLQQLNPKIDANTLHAGQKLKLRPST